MSVRERERERERECVCVCVREREREREREILHHNDARLHMVHLAQDSLECHYVDMMVHPPYSLDLTPL